MRQTTRSKLICENAAESDFTTKWVFSSWIEVKQNIVSFTMVWYNMEFFTWCIQSYRILFGVHEQLKYEIFIQKNISKYWCLVPLRLHFFLICIYCFSSVIVLGCQYLTLKFAYCLLLLWSGLLFRWVCYCMKDHYDNKIVEYNYCYL